MSKAARLCSLLILGISFLVCAYGVHATGLLTDPRWIALESSIITATVVAFLAAALLFAARSLDIGFPWAVGLSFVLVAAAFAGLGPTFAVLLQIGSAFCIGNHLLRSPLAELWGPGLAGVLKTVLGLAVLSFVLYALSFLPVNNPATYLALLLLPVLVGWRRHAGALAGLWGGWHRGPASDGGFWPPAMYVVIATALTLKLFAVLRPEIGVDALATHLVIANQVKTDGEFHYDVTQSIWAVMPLASDWQFAMANMLSGQAGARLVNFSAELLACALIFLFGRQVKSPLAGTAAVLLYVTTPLTHLETTSLFTENFWTLWFLGALALGVASVRARYADLAAASGFLLGTTLAAKVITIFLAPFFLAIVGAWLVLARTQALRNIALAGAAAATAAGIPYLNALVTTGNPVFPFMNDYFQSPYFDTAASFDNPLFKTSLGWRSLYDVTFNTGSYLESHPGGMGTGLLLFLPAAMFYALWRSWAFRIGLACLVLFVAGVFHFQSYLRYILPILPLCAVLVGALVASLSEGSRVTRSLVLSVLLASSLAGLYLTRSSNHYYGTHALPDFWGTDEQADFVDSVRPEQSLIRVIEAMNLGRVLWLGAPYIGGTGTDVYVVNWHGGKELAEKFHGIETPDALQKLVAEGKFEAIAVATGFDTCERPAICAFLESKANLIYSVGGASLYRVEADLLFDREILANPGFDGSQAPWGGEGTYVAGEDGAVVVSALKSFSQAVPVTGNERYFLEVRGRCTTDAADYRMQVNWLDASGTFITTNISVVPCEPDYSVHSTVVTAPDNAASAVVYASGHAPDKTAEITDVSFRK